MDRDGLKAIIGGMAEALKLVVDQPGFQALQNIDCENGETVRISLNVAIQLLDTVWEALDQEVPELLVKDSDIQVYREFLEKCLE